MIAADTTVAIAAALPGHESHLPARRALAEAKPRLIAHVALETYSVLTRLPGSERVPPPVVRSYLRERFRTPALVLSEPGYERLLDDAAALGIAGGAIYDALIAATAREAGATLLTLDRRAIRTYAALDVDYRMLA